MFADPVHRFTAVRGCLIASCLGILSEGLLAQATGTTTGDLRGRVTDESGAVLPGVLVTATSRETALARSATTGSNGDFAIRLLPPAPYRVSAALDGFEPLAVESVRILLGSSANLELRLKIAAVAESVTVGARVSVIDPTSTDVSQTIDETMIRNLPINERDFLDFALTTPGVEADRGPQTGAASTSGFSINGQSPRANNVLVDGLDNNDQAVGSVRSTFSQDAVEEYQVIQSSFAAEHGRATGGIVNIVTRSGSNDLHGSAFYFFRDDSLAAENRLAGTKTPFEQHQYGVSAGGPLLRERLFAFGAVERLSVADANVVTISDTAVSAIVAAGFDVENGVVPFDRDQTAAIVKLDWAPRPAHRFSLRGTYAEEKDENQQAWGGLVARSGGGVRRVEDSALAASAISVLSESASNEARFLYAGRRHRLESLDPAGGVSVAILGVASFGPDPTLPQPRDSTVFQVFDAVSLFRANASYKVGVDYLHTRIEGRLPLYFGGRYLFSPLPIPGATTAVAAFQRGLPLLFLQGFGDPRLEDSTTELAGFAQGEWGFGKNFFLRAGIRYDLEDPIAPFPEDSNNWAPRLSFSWVGGNTWRIHGGIGRFYGVVPIAPASLIAIEDGTRARIVARTLVDSPPSDYFWSLPDRRFDSEPGADPIPLIIYRLGHFESAYSDQATLGFEKALGRTLLFYLDYLHSRGRKVLIEHNVNPDAVNGRLDDAHGDVFAYDSIGNTWYEAITVGLRTGPGRPVELAAHYTYADAEDDHIDWSKNQPQDPLDIGAERGPTVHVARHHAVLSAVWTAAGRGGGWWLRDWTAAVIADYASGFPYNELAGFDRNGNKDAFSDRPVGVGRNRRTLPDFFNVDLRVARRFPVGRANLEAIVECFNLFDRENVLEVNNVRYEGASLDLNRSFGEPTRVADPRRIQLGVRLTF